MRLNLISCEKFSSLLTWVLFLLYPHPHSWLVQITKLVSLQSLKLLCTRDDIRIRPLCSVCSPCICPPTNSKCISKFCVVSLHVYPNVSDIKGLFLICIFMLFGSVTIPQILELCCRSSDPIPAVSDSATPWPLITLVTGKSHHLKTGETFTSKKCASIVLVFLRIFSSYFVPFLVDIFKVVSEEMSILTL